MFNGIFCTAISMCVAIHIPKFCLSVSSGGFDLFDQLHRMLPLWILGPGTLGGMMALVKRFGVCVEKGTSAEGNGFGGRPPTLGNIGVGHQWEVMYSKGP